MSIAINNLFYVTDPSVVWDCESKIRIPELFTSVEMYITKDYDIVHVPNQTVYKRDRAIAIEKLVYSDVPDLAINGQSVHLMLLLAGIFKPLNLLPTDYVYTVGSPQGPTVKVLNLEYRDNPAESLFWQYPKEGILVPNTGLTEKVYYIPALKDVYVREDGEILNASYALFEKGENRTTYYVKSSADETALFELTQKELVALALGLYDATDLSCITIQPDGVGGTEIGPIMELFTTVDYVGTEAPSP